MTARSYPKSKYSPASLKPSFLIETSFFASACSFAQATPSSNIATEIASSGALQERPHFSGLVLTRSTE